MKLLQDISSVLSTRNTRSPAKIDRVIRINATHPNSPPYFSTRERTTLISRSLFRGIDPCNRSNFIFITVHCSLPVGPIKIYLPMTTIDHLVLSLSLSFRPSIYIYIQVEQSYWDKVNYKGSRHRKLENQHALSNLERGDRACLVSATTDGRQVRTRRISEILMMPSFERRRL